MPDFELLWALCATGLLLFEQVRHRRALRREVETLRISFGAAAQRNEELSAAADRMGELYKSQLLTSRKRAARIKKVLEIATSINSNLAIDKVLHEIVHAVSDAAGFRIVLLRVLHEQSGTFQARAFAGLSRDAIQKLEQQPVRREEFESWLREEFRIGRSYFISHESRFWPPGDSEGYTPDLGVRHEGEWHAEDVLFVPLYTKDGGVLGYLSVDDPVDRKPPTRETVEMLEILATQAVVALQNAALYERLTESLGQLEEATERAEELNRMKSSFVSTVSHELRTPLAAVLAYTEGLVQQLGTANVGRQREFLKVILEQGQKLQRLIESILDLSQLESGRIRMHRGPFNAVALVKEVAEELKRIAEPRGLSIETETEAMELIVEADRDLVRRVLHQLGSNALKFTPDGGRVVLRSAGEGRTVRLEVEDSGIGIPREEMDKIFDQFYQVDGSLSREYPGVGLGLSIARSIVEWHGGEILVDSEVGKGSRFTVVLPATAEDASVITRATWSPTRSVSDHLTRLTVEMISEVMNARTASLMLVDEQADELYIKAARGLREEVVTDTRVKIGDSIAGWVAKHGQPLLVTNIEEDPRFNRPNLNQYETKSLLSVPVKLDGRVVGVININNKISCTPFTDDDRALLSTLSDRVACAWKHVTAHEASAEQAERTARALGAIIENARRSRFRRGTADMASLATATGRRLGLGQRDLEVLAYVASVHDVGMGHIDPAALDAPGELNSRTLAEVSRHPIRSVETLKPIEFEEQVTEIILAHHERMDGRGYPRGLKGDQIPLGARIIGVLDAYVSMTTGRPYRAAMSHNEAIAELRRCAGSQFDPKVVDVFMQIHIPQEDAKLVRTREAA
jgi:signal transduction histidine kinase/HD-GYP domain-containing protein (c-di-GMP phosphodiesterase class II)